MNTINHYSPAELLEIYPQASKLGWTPAKLGSFFRGGLLVGFISGKENKAFITEASFIKLMKFVSEVNRDRDLIT